MRRRWFAWLCLGVLVGIHAPAHGAAGTAKSSAPPPGPSAASKPVAGGGAAPPARDRWLPDTTELARVQDRAIRAGEFCDSYFASDPEFRPKPDSTGRVDFLTSMIHKEVLALVALKVNRPLDFEDRATLREHTGKVLANVLYQRIVIDSIPVTEADLQRVYEQYQHEVRLKQIQFVDRPTAERVRRDLVAGRITWPVAVQKYSIAANKTADGDLGWRPRLGMDANLAYSVCDLKVGEISDVFEDVDGYHLAMIADRRTATPPSLNALRSNIVEQYRGPRAGRRTREIQTRLLSTMNVSYHDSTIAWVAAHFKTNAISMTPGAINIDPNLPDFAPADTSRILARAANGATVSLGRFLHTISDMPPMMRPPVGTPAALKDQVDAILLEPRMVELAYERGIDKDPMAVTLIEKKREQILVEHLFQDSIQTHVRVTDAMRRKYYEDNKAGFITYPKVRYASLLAHSKAGADSLKARLARGEKAETILFADSVAGIPGGSIQERQQNQHGPYQKVLFEELRPGQATMDGPDSRGDYVVIQLLAFDPGHQLPFSEVESIVDESVQNQVADRMLSAFIDRHSRGLVIESHPERVMRIELSATK